MILYHLMVSVNQEIEPIKVKMVGLRSMSKALAGRLWKLRAPVMWKVIRS